MVDRRVEEQRETDNVVEFPPIDQAPIFDVDSQERGQIFAAHRMMGRIADQLDSVGAL